MEKRVSIAFEYGWIGASKELEVVGFYKFTGQTNVPRDVSGSKQSSIVKDAARGLG